MKLLKLSLENLNSFRRREVIDFTNAPLNEASLVAITGPTGAGKTTLLDALCVALYNRTPRLSSGQGNENPGNLLSQGKTEGVAEVIFEANGTRYLSEWRVERDRKGQIKTPAVKLVNVDTNTLISERHSSHSAAVEAILGLDFGAFSRSVMLAQGEFAAFLKADADKRREILEATTGIDIYEKLKGPLSDKIKAVKGEYDKIEAVFNKMPDVNPVEIEAARTQLEALETTAQTLEREQQNLREQIGRENQRAQAHQKLIEAQGRQEELLNQQPEITRLQSELDDAHRAAGLRPERLVFEREGQNFKVAQNALTDVQRALENAQNEYGESSTAFNAIDAQYQAMRVTRAPKMEAYHKATIEESR
ncbi:AAA family ATPase, partial [Candidatus Poribacteria bacterium]|nr:AAA family ATPase [Candidatus Poribacteria bacterium]